MEPRVFLFLSTAGVALAQYQYDQFPQNTINRREPCYPRAARADLVPGTSDVTSGVVYLYQDCPGYPVSVSGRITGLTPGKHGLHIHEFPNLDNECDDTGAHFNPFNVSHGGQMDGIKDRHVGDLGNIQADYNGVADFYIVDLVVDLYPGERNVFFRSIAVTADPDDLGKGGNDTLSAIDGNSGRLLACGVIAPNNNVCA